MLELPAKLSESQFFIEGNDPNGEKIYRTVVAYPSVGLHLRPSATPAVTAKVQSPDRLQDMPWIDLRGGRKATGSFNIYAYDRTDDRGRLLFSWTGMQSTWLCSWLDNTRFGNMSMPYDRMFILVNDQLLKLPSDKTEWGTCKVCDFCPNQFACLAGQPPVFLVADDLPIYKPYVTEPSWSNPNGGL